MRPKLCLFTDSIEPSGVGEHMLSLAEELRPEYDIFFLGWSSTPLYRRAAQSGFAVYELSIDWYAHKALFERLRPDIVHVHAGVSWEGHGGVWAARHADVGVVVRTEHLPYLITEKWQQDEYRKFVEYADAVVCVSEGVRQSFADAGVPAPRLRVVRNGIQVHAANGAREQVRQKLHAEFGLSEDSKLVLTVGRLTQQKGYGQLLQAACQVAARLPHAHFLLAGEGPLEGELRGMADACGATPNVHFLGSRPDVKELMSACDLFVLPSHFEGLPLVVLEAMAAGRAVVATDVCGTNEAVVHGTTGLLVPPGDVQALSRAIVHALTRPDLLQGWGEAGRERVLRHFTRRQMASATSVIYHSYLGRSPGVAGHNETHGMASHAHTYMQG